VTGPLLDLYPNRGLRFVAGDGPYLEASDGRRYLDLMTNYGVSIFGHRHPSITAALSAQIDALTTLHGSFGSDVRLKASLALCRRLPMESPAICWSNSGAEAIEAALKFAAMSTAKKRFVACRGAYHGKTLGALSATDSPKYRAPFEPLLWDFEHVPYGDAAALRKAIDDRTAAVIVEPIQGEGGVRVPPAGYLTEVRRLASDAGVLLVVDEIQSGCGRTGRFLAIEHEGVSPDIVCLGKGLAGGVPVGATAVTGAIAASIPRGLHTSTFGGSPLACAGALAVLGLLTDELLSRVARLGERFVASLRQAVPPGGTVRGLGLMVGVGVGGRRDEILKGLQRAGVLAIPAGDDVVRFLPPYIVEPEQLDMAAETLGRLLEGARFG
jgi:acetylornithine/succinyldiaminopimelate/putrescine aminotransferase